VPVRPPGNVIRRTLDETAGYALFDRIGLSRAPSVELASDIIVAPRLPFPFPVAVKVLSADATHKTELGGVVLNVADGAALVAAIKVVRDNAVRHGTRVSRVLVQPMASGVGEALIGYRVDADAGPVVVLAAGGILTEIYQDRALRLAPVDHAVAREMIAEVKGLKVLAGFRGQASGDIEALADAVVRVSTLALMPEVLEAEANPVIVCSAGQGVVAVDALVIVAAPPEP
jgi:acyl-CoA synthetase (NDP forming)